MKYILKITPTAFADISNGKEYYNIQQVGLGNRFSSMIDKTLKKIKKMPFAASFAYNEVRYKVVDKFPYVILYTIKERYIHIDRIFNTHQNTE